MVNKGARSDDLETKPFVFDSPRYSPDQIEKIIATSSGGLPETPDSIKKTDPDGRQLDPLIVDRRQVLEAKLEAAAQSYIVNRSLHKRLAPSAKSKQLSSIHKATQRLLKAMGLPEGSDANELHSKIPLDISIALFRQAERMGERIGGFPSHPPTKRTINRKTHAHFKGSQKFMEVVEGIVMLRDWASDAATSEKSQIGSISQGNQGDVPLRKFIGELVAIWTDILEQSVGTSVGKPGSALEGQATGPLIRFIQACFEPLKIKKTNESVRDYIRGFSQGKGK